MSNDYKKNNGYYKFYNAEGISCRIKCTYQINGEIIIKFRRVDENGRNYLSDWLYYTPKKSFTSCFDAANFILKNLENEGMIFKIISTNTTFDMEKDNYANVVKK